MNTAITDKYGDPIEVSVLEGFLVLDVEESEYVLEREAAIQLRDTINEFLDDTDDTDEFFYADEVSPNEGKLRLAAMMGLKAKFAYAGERDYRAVERRVAPDTVGDHNGVTYVLGESYDEGGVSEGLRQFRLDRISGDVVIR